MKSRLLAMTAALVGVVAVVRAHPRVNVMPSDVGWTGKQITIFGNIHYVV